MLQGKIAWIHLCYIHNYRCKICCLDMSEDVTHYIGLLHHPWLYLSVYMGALSPVKGMWLPLWVPCPPWRECGCLRGRPVPREGSVAAFVGTLSPWTERGCLCGCSAPCERSMAASVGALLPGKGTWLPPQVVMSISHHSWLLAHAPTSVEENK